jgi:hypothetical protein
MNGMACLQTLIFAIGTEQHLSSKFENFGFLLTNSSNFEALSRCEPKTFRHIKTSVRPLR